MTGEPDVFLCFFEVCSLHIKMENVKSGDQRHRTNQQPIDVKQKLSSFHICDLQKSFFKIVFENQLDSALLHNIS